MSRGPLEVSRRKLTLLVPGQRAWVQPINQIHLWPDPGITGTCTDALGSFNSYDLMIVAVTPASEVKLPEYRREYHGDLLAHVLVTGQSEKPGLNEGVPVFGWIDVYPTVLSSFMFYEYTTGAGGYTCRSEITA